MNRIYISFPPKADFFFTPLQYIANALQMPDKSENGGQRFAYAHPTRVFTIQLKALELSETLQKENAIIISARTVMLEIGDVLSGQRDRSAAVTHKITSEPEFFVTDINFHDIIYIKKQACTV